MHFSSLTAANKSTAYHLPFSPQHLSGFDVIYVIFLIFWKHLLRFFKLSSPLAISPDGHTFDLPPLRLSAPLHLSEHDLDLWEQATSSSHRLDGEKLRHSIFLPVAITTPLLLLLLGHSKSPVLPLGTVNTKNRFEFLDPPACRNLQTTISKRKLLCVARAGGTELPGRRVKRGMEFDAIVEIVDLSGDGTSTVLFRQVVSTLQFLPAKHTPEATSQTTKVEEHMDFKKEPGLVGLDFYGPHQWAAVCKDYNPIHMSSLTAKIFGFPSKIAHGNHVVAKFVEKMEPEDGNLLKQLWWISDSPSFLEVAFKRPVILPAQLGFQFDCLSGMNSVKHFEITNREKVNITGKAGWLL